MKRFLTTTAIVLTLGSTAYAQNTPNLLLDYQFEATTDLFATNLIGKRVHASEIEIDLNTTIEAGTEVEQDWNDIGEINDIILTRSGEVAAVIVGVGGFLGIGEKDVAVDMSQIQIVREDGTMDEAPLHMGEYFLVINATQTDLEAAPDFVREEDDMAGNARVEAETETSTMAMDERMDRDMFVAPQIDRDGYAEAEPVDLTTETLTGARVFDANDEDIGEVSELTLSNDGMIEKVIIDVGGFIGLGEKRVALTFDEVRILRSDDGDSFRVYVDATQETLEAQPTFEG